MFSLIHLKAVTFLLFCATTMSIAQFNKNAFYGNFGGSYGIGSGIHYERIIAGGPYAHLSLNSGLGYTLKGIDNYENKILMPYGLGLSVGLRKHFLECNAIFINHVDAGIAEGFDVYILPRLIGASLQLGYKYMSELRPGLYMKIYACANYLSGQTLQQDKFIPNNTKARIFESKMQPGLGLALGMSF